MLCEVCIHPLLSLHDWAQSFNMPGLPGTSLVRAADAR
jgi:hypothetical protein